MKKTRLSRAPTMKTHQGKRKILAIKVTKTKPEGKKREKEEANMALIPYWTSNFPKSLIC